MNNLKAIFLDMDGVVVDNHQYHFEAWMEFSRRYNFKLNDEIYKREFNGKTNLDLFTGIFGEISEQQVLKYALEKEGLYHDLYTSNMRPLKGLNEFLEFLQSKKLKIALGTSAPTMNVDYILDGLRLRGYFDVIVDGTQVQKGKPDPQVYQMCAMKLGIDPRHAVVFEDALLGLEAGIMAGCSVVGVATTMKASELKVKTDNIIHDFTEARKIIGL